VSARERASVPWVGVLQLEVGCPWVRSLKQKRALIAPLLERWRRGYSLSVVRTAGLDAHGGSAWRSSPWTSTATGWRT
jgi:hypothetical protein